MRLVSTIFLFYCSLVAVFLAVSGLLTSKGAFGIATQVIFLPVFLYFVWALILALRGRLDLSLEGKRIQLIIAFVIFLVLITLSYFRLSP